MFEPYAWLGGPIGLPSSVGLGLYVSRLLARMMGGDIRYARRDGQTEFCLVLPAEGAASLMLDPSPKGMHRYELVSF